MAILEVLSEPNRVASTLCVLHTSAHKPQTESYSPASRRAAPQGLQLKRHIDATLGTGNIMEVGVADAVRAQVHCIRQYGAGVRP